MPHMRSRLIAPAIQKSILASPIVGIFGLRQVGKSTLLAKISSEYSTLDLSSEQQLVEQDPMGYLAERKEPFGIDESQMVPSLFPALKETVRRLAKPGRFILSGSVRFTSRKLIRESLTGRILMHELFPMCMAETHAKNAADPTVFHSSKNPLPYTKKDWSRYIQFGGMPGICFKRDSSIQGIYYESHLDTLLNRDLRLIVQTKLSLPTLRRFLHTLSLSVGHVLDVSKLARETGIGRDTAKQLISAFESLYLIRLISVEGGSTKFVVLWEDVGLLQHVSQGRLSPYAVLLNAFYANVRCALLYKRTGGSFSQFQTRGGAHVSLVYRDQSKCVAWVLSNDSLATRSNIASARSFLKVNRQASVFITSIAVERVDEKQLLPGIYQQNLLRLI